MWIVLAAALVVSADLDVSDRQTQTVSLPPSKPLSIEVTIGTVRIDGWDRPDAEIVVERRVPTTAQFARVPLSIEEHSRLVLLFGPFKLTTAPTLPYAPM